MKSNYDLILWLFIFLLIAFIFGLYIAENHKIPKALFDRTPGGASTPYMEHFGERSSAFDVSGGASSRYGWGISDDDYVRRMINKKDTHINDNGDGDLDEEEIIIREKCKKNDEDKKEEVQKCIRDHIFKSKSSICPKCDILDHPDIDKYVLKSSVPPCPNMSEYIRKSEIPSCPKIDLNEYVKKSEIPSPKVCPTIEKCPVCPEIPKDLKYRKEIKNIQEFRITDVNDVEMLLRDKRVKEYLDQNYEKKNQKNIPQPNTYSYSSSSSTSPSNIETEDEHTKRSTTSKNNFIPTSSLMNELKSLFGFGNNNKKEVQQEETYKISSTTLSSSIPSSTSSSTSSSTPSSISSSTPSSIPSSTPSTTLSSSIKINKNYYSEEEDTRMIYNKDCPKPQISDQIGLYAGDNLYSAANW
jgi:hypothetical protein